jgi:hypoxanthine phosphoribosyltransferase
MISAPEAWSMLESAEQICPAEDVTAAVQRLAGEISARLGESQPLVLSVMGGAVVFTGQLLPLLHFPLDFDYIHVSRYGNETQGGSIEWKALPRENVAGRVVLVVDDILDEGHTMVAIREKIMALGAKAFYSAVFAEKETGRPKPMRADFVGITVPNCFVFGFGMDAYGAWRNLPAVYALKQE